MLMCRSFNCRRSGMDIISRTALFLAISMARIQAVYRICHFHHALELYTNSGNINKLWSRSYGKSLLSCGMKCLADRHCVVVLVDRVQEQCAGLQSVPTRTTGSQSKFAVYYPSCRVPHDESSPVIKGKPCQTAASCNNETTGMMCFDGKCICPLLLRYSPSTDSCGNCIGYGSTFSVYHHRGIDHHNDRNIYNLKSFQECQVECLSETNFTCRSFEYKPMPFGFVKAFCYLSVSLYRDVPDLDPNRVTRNWNLALRDCH